MSINNLNTYLNVRDAHLRVVSGNVYAQAMNIGGINVETAHGLQSVSNTGNATSLTLEFANVTTGFVTTANAQIGRDLVVTGNATVSKELTVTSNAIVSSNLNVSDDLIVTNNILASNNLTVTGNLNVTTIMSDSNVVAEYTGPHDRPLRKYPEVALTANDNLSTSGYKASVSSQLTSNDAFSAFDATGATTYWHSQYPYYTHVTGTYNPGQSSSGTGTPSGTLPTTELISGHQGEWIKLQMPTRIKLEEVRVYASNRAASSIYQMPKDIAIAGSNDGTNWYLVDSGTLRTGIRESYGMASLPVTTSSYYSYLALIVKSIDNQGANYSAIEIANIEYYGREEGSGSLDTTLKTVYNVPATTGTQLEVYYDAKGESTVQSPIPDLSPNTNTGAVSGHSPTLDSTDGIDSFKFNGSSQYVTGTHGLTTGSDPVHTISLWLNATEMTNYSYAVQLGQGGTSHQQSAIMFYENRISHAHWISGVLSNVTLAKNVWYHVVAVFTGGNGSDLTKHKIFINGEDGGVGLFPGSTSDGPVVLTGTQLTLGRKENAGGTPGDYFNGSIANFRLYSKALNAEQIQELYDFQKDYFLGSKSQVTLYKGHLGVGVTEPSGQLELAGDERIQEYPPRALTGYSTHIEGHGVFEVENSSVANSNYRSFDAFDKDEDPLVNTAGWVSGLNTYDTGGTGLASGGSATDYFSTYGPGSWLKLKLPYAIKLKSSKFSIRAPSTLESLKSFTIYGSRDNTNWDALYSQSTSTPQSFSIDINSTEYYKCFVIHITEVDHNQGYAGIVEWRLFGTPGPTTLDQGSLSLGRSLDVPRVSRYDVDTETPRPERLILDLDTTVNSSPTDISGKGNHGILQGAAKISEAHKAFTGAVPESGFNGNSNYISGNLNGVSGAYAHTQSYWVNGADTTPRCAFTVGKDINTTREFLNIWFTTSKWVLNADGAAGGEWAETIYDNRWYHVVLTYDGGSSASSYKLYINGEYKTPTTTITASTTLNLPSNPEYRIGRNNGSQWYNGMVSNPKVYSVVLEPSEIKKLYRLGRTGRSMVISDTAVGIGKAPEANLDVRGSARFDSFTKMLRINHPGNQLSIGRTDTHLSEFRFYAWSNGCNWFTPYSGKNIYVGRDGQTISEFDFYNVTTVKRGSSIISSSDDRLKRDEAFITNATDTLLKLKPQIYIKKHRLPENENENSDDIPEQLEAGLIAQDVWYDAPELKFLVHPSKDANPSETKPVSPDPNDPTQDPDYSSWGTTQAYINYEGLIPYLIKATQEQYEKTQSMKSELNLIHELQIENNRLKNKVAILENRQTHFNTLLVNLTGRIETLERGA